MSRTKYKVGTRGSKLALAQAQRVIDLLHSFDPEADFTIEIVQTAADGANLRFFARGITLV